MKTLFTTRNALKLIAVCVLILILFVNHDKKLQHGIGQMSKADAPKVVWFIDGTPEYDSTHLTTKQIKQLYAIMDSRGTSGAIDTASWFSEHSEIKR